MALLSLKNISRTFGSTKAVSDVSLDVAQGEFFGLLGPSGCGKTTTLRMIAGLENPDSGSIEFQGADITNLPPERRGFGMVFQNYALFPHLNVFENVAFGLRARHKNKSEMTERVASALELVQLPGYGKRAVDQLSGGQQQRVAIARAIAIEPALLLFDEPLSNLDVSLREETRSELRELVTRLGLTAVYVTHDQEEAFALCDRISVMVGGKLMQTGRPRELYEQPAEISVASFLGRNNLIKAMRLSSSKNSDGEFKTLEGGHTLHLTVKHDELAPLNKPVFLAIRPEHVQLSGNDNSAENSLRGNIREIVFAGATSTVRVDAGGLLLEALVLRTNGLRVDQECNVVSSQRSSNTPQKRTRMNADRRTRIRLSFVALVLITAVVLIYGVVYPNLSVVVTSFQRAGSWTLANYRELLSQRIVIEAIVSSLGLSIGTVALCAIVGVPLAFLFERFTFPGRRVFAALAALPLVLPPLVGTVAFIFLFGESGILAHGIQNLFALESLPWRLRGWPALLLFHTYTMYPFFYVLTGAGLRRIDASLAEAARSLGASRSVVLRRVLLPQLTPSLLAAALLTFMTSMASFSAPLFFGGDVRVLTLEIFTARQRGDVVIAVTETVILAIISLGALIFFQRYEGTRRFAAAAMKGAPRRRVSITSGKARALATIVAVVFAIILVAPVATLFLVSFAREGSWTTQTFPSAYTLENYQRLFGDPYSAEVFFNSVTMSAIAAVAALVWSFCIVTLLRRRRDERKFAGEGWRRLLSLLVLIPWALPGTVVAVSVAEAYGQPSALLGSFVLVGTFWILPVVYFLRFMPLVVRALQASMEQLDPTLEEAAGSLGARAWQRFMRVTLPLVWPGAVAGTLLAFVIALGEYVASVLVFVPANRPISIAIASELRDFNLGAAAAYGVVLIVIISISMVVAGKLERLRG